MRLLPLFFAASVSASASAALAQPDQTPATIANPPAQLQPGRAPRPVVPKAQIELDLKTLFTALNGLSTETQFYNYDIPAFVAGGRAGYFGLSEWKSYFVATRGKTQFRLDQIEITSLNNDTARVNVSYSLLIPNYVHQDNAQPTIEIRASEQQESLELKRETVPWDRSEKWRIVPPTFEKLQRRTLSLQNIAYHGAQRAGTLSQLREVISVSRLKQIGLGAMQFVQDYDEQFLFQNEFWRDALKPYVRSESLFLIPGTQTPYTFNDQLSDKSLAAVESPAETVLFYEGEAEKPTFRYDGKAAICFADGHVKLVSPAEAAVLRWKP
ncbi:MAG TPA: hypothetical protein VF627_11005 [Abditibacterium sp.]|jgi:prepilin-type processing-associated H-X9-DG protein